MSHPLFYPLWLPPPLQTQTGTLASLHYSPPPRDNKMPFLSTTPSLPPLRPPGAFTSIVELAQNPALPCGYVNFDWFAYEALRICWPFGAIALSGPRPLVNGAHCKFCNPRAVAWDYHCD